MLCWLASCSGASNSPQQENNAQLQQQAAHATEKARSDAKVATIEARNAADAAAQKVRAVASGVKEGMEKPGQARGIVDINSAGQTRLETLPGVGERTAQRIIDGRPYAARADLLQKGVVSKAEYERIEDLITAR